MIYVIGIGLACLIVIGLSAYAGSLLGQLYDRKKEQEAVLKERLNYIYKSVYTISFAMQQGQCELSEGCIRVAVLLDNLPETEWPTQAFNQKFASVYDLYEKIKHMPTHDARLHYKRSEIRKMDREREALEEEMKDDILLDVQAVLDWLKERNLP